MHGKGPKQIGEFGYGEAVQALEDALKATAELFSLWQKVVGATLAQHSRPLYYANGQLLVQADGSAWASRIRYQQRELLRSLRKQPALADLRGLRVRVIPTTRPEAAEPGPTPDRPQLSASSAAIITNMAESIDDNDLREALQRLGRWTGAPKS